MRLSVVVLCVIHISFKSLVLPLIVSLNLESHMLHNGGAGGDPITLPSTWRYLACVDMITSVNATTARVISPEFNLSEAF